MLVVSMKQKDFVHYYIVGYIRVKKKKTQTQQSNSSNQKGMLHSQACGTSSWLPVFHSYGETDSI